ncbi:unnamed protein product [Fusarium graminearum]|nr:unnamed protein product [Fusarium graminearum]
MYRQGWNETPQRGSRNIPNPYGFQPNGTHWADEYDCLPLCQGGISCGKVHPGTGGHTAVQCLTPDASQMFGPESQPVNWDHNQRATAANQPASQIPFPAPSYPLGYITQPPARHLASSLSMKAERPLYPGFTYPYNHYLTDVAEDSAMPDWCMRPLTPDPEEQERWEQIVSDGAQDVGESSSGKEKDQVDPVTWEVSAKACQTELETINDKVDFVVRAMKKLLDQKQEGQTIFSHNDARLEVETEGESSGSQSVSCLQHRRSKRKLNCRPRLKRESANEIDARKKLEALVEDPSQSADCTLDAPRYDMKIMHSKGSNLANLEDSSIRTDLTPTVATTPNEETETSTLVLDPKQMEGMGDTHHINKISSELDIKEEDAEKKAKIRDGPIWKYRIRHPAMVQPRNVDVDNRRIYAKLLAQSNRQTKPWNGDLSNLEAFLLGPFCECDDNTGIRDKIFNLFAEIPGVSIELCYVKNEQRMKLFVLVPPFYAENENGRSSFELMKNAEDVSKLLLQQRADCFDVEIWEANFRLDVV